MASWHPRRVAKAPFGHSESAKFSGETCAERDGAASGAADELFFSHANAHVSNRADAAHVSTPDARFLQRGRGSLSGRRFASSSPSQPSQSFLSQS